MPVNMTELCYRIQHQIEFYFSAENLNSDWFMHKNMDDEGWVAIDVIMKFRRIAALTNDKAHIIMAMSSSHQVELSPCLTKLRKRMHMLPSVSYQNSYAILYYQPQHGFTYYH